MALTPDNMNVPYGQYEAETFNMWIGEIECPHCKKMDYHCVNWDAEDGRVVCIYCNAPYIINKPTAEALPEDI